MGQSARAREDSGVLFSAASRSSKLEQKAKREQKTKRNTNKATRVADQESSKQRKNKRNLTTQQQYDKQVNRQESSKHTGQTSSNIKARAAAAKAGPQQQQQQHQQQQEQTARQQFKSLVNQLNQTNIRRTNSLPPPQKIGDKQASLVIRHLPLLLLVRC